MLLLATLLPITRLRQSVTDFFFIGHAPLAIPPLPVLLVTTLLLPSLLFESPTIFAKFSHTSLPIPSPLVIFLATLFPPPLLFVLPAIFREFSHAFLSIPPPLVILVTTLLLLSSPSYLPAISSSQACPCVWTCLSALTFPPTYLCPGLSRVQTFSSFCDAFWTFHLKWIADPLQLASTFSASLCLHLRCRRASEETVFSASASYVCARDSDPTTFC